MERDLGFKMPAELAASGLLPSPPGVVMEILRLVGDENSTVEDLAQVIDADPVLAGRLLGTVNSGLYTLAREIHSVDQAAVLVGFRAIRTLALSASLADGVPGGPSCQGFDLEMYWRHCLMTAVLGRHLATRVKRRLGEDGFAVGLIANVGRLVVARCVPERYSRALMDSPWPDDDTELAVLGYTTTQVSSALLHRWGLPAGLCAAVLYRHGAEDLPSEFDEDTRVTATVVGAADKAVDHLLRAVDDDDIHTVAAEISAAIDLSIDDVHAVLDEAGQQVGETKHLISNSLPDGINPADLISRAQTLLEEASV